MPVTVTMVEKRGKCHYQLGKTWRWDKGWDGSERVCRALDWSLHWPVVLCALGAKSWEQDPDVWRISCPSKRGTVWEVRAETPR